MNRRTLAIAVITGAVAAGMPAAAVASLPLPDPPPRHVALANRDWTLQDLVDAYGNANVAERRRIHTEITMVLHHNPQGWTI